MRGFRAERGECEGAEIGLRGHVPPEDVLAVEVTPALAAEAQVDAKLVTVLDESGERRRHCARPPGVRILGVPPRAAVTTVLAQPLVDLADLLRGVLDVLLVPVGVCRTTGGGARGAPYVALVAGRRFTPPAGEARPAHTCGEQPDEAEGCLEALHSVERAAVRARAGCPRYLPVTPATLDLVLGVGS
jgi:hypothetical protein